MARKIEKTNDCMGCPECIGCGRNINRTVEYLECDRCGSEFDELYVLNGRELCEDCLKDEIETVTL